MGREKQIEEMANALYCKQDEYDISNPFEVAKAVIDLGYQKINEDDIVLSRSEHQHYLAYKLIEPQIKGCLDRERELERRIQELEAGQKNLISREKAQAVECKSIFALKAQAKKDIEQAREETAREITEKLLKDFKRVDGVIALCYAIGALEERAKEFGVEVD